MVNRSQFDFYNVVVHGPNGERTSHRWVPKHLAFDMVATLLCGQWVSIERAESVTRMIASSRPE